MEEFPFAIDQIVGWFRAKQIAVAGSDVSLAEIRQRIEYLPAAVADFDAKGAMGRISAWVSGDFDFEVIRISDGENLFWRHLHADSVKDLEEVYADFLRSLRSCGNDGQVG